MKKVLVVAAVLALLSNITGLQAMQPNNRVQVSSEAEFTNVLNNNPLVVLLVSTTWCGPCKKLKPIVEQLTSEMPNVTFAHVDGDSKQLSNLVSKYASEGFPSIAIFKNGNKVGEVGGFVPKQELRTAIQKHVGSTSSKVVAQKDRRPVIPVVAKPQAAKKAETPQWRKPATQPAKATKQVVPQWRKPVAPQVTQPVAPVRKPYEAQQYDDSSENGDSSEGDYSDESGDYSSEDNDSSEGSYSDSDD